MLPLPTFGFQSPHHRRNALAILALLLTLGCLVTPIFAQRSEQAVAQPVQVDWPAVVRDAQTLSPQLSSDPKDKAFSARHRTSVAKRLDSYALKDGMVPLAHLNEHVVELFPGVATVPVPVLVPFETARFLSQKARSKGDRPRLRPSQHRDFLYGAGGNVRLVPGTTGYDALVTFAPSTLQSLGITSKEKPLLHIGGSALTYGDAEPGVLVAELQDQYPGLRRSRNEEDVTYTFRKYGVPYFATVVCTDTPTNQNVLKCEQADALVRAALRNFHLIGGGPMARKSSRASAVVVSGPTGVSAEFKYYPPGKLLPGSGVDGQGGSTDASVYGDILFPIKLSPTFAQSQVYMHWGDCGGGNNKQPLPKQTGDKHARYKCKQNDKQLLEWEGHPENYAYPWRDNFCEARDRDTLKCPAGRGHQGQDIRPSKCIPKSNDPERCQPDIHDVVAVADGVAFRDGNIVRLKVDGSAVYYVYLHMNTGTLDAAGIKNQQDNPVRKGQVIGKVGDFQDVPGGTTAHLHFEVRTAAPKMPQSPYMTLIRAYERLIGAQGTEITD